MVTFSGKNRVKTTMLKYILTFSLLSQFYPIVENHRIVSILSNDSTLPYSLELSRPVIELAIEEATRLYPRVLFDQFSFRNASIDCRTNFAGVVAAEEHYSKSTPVAMFIGPPCEYALDPVAKMASYWNIPVFTSGGLDQMFTNKSIYKTLTRLSLTYSNVGVFLRLILEHHKWNKVSIVVHETNQLVTTIRKSIEDNLNVNIFYEIHEITQSLSKLDFKSLLSDCVKTSSIIITLISDSTLEQILHHAHAYQMANGRMTFIAFHIQSQVDRLNWLSELSLRESTSIRRSLLLIGIKSSTNSAIETFIEKLSARVHQNLTRYNLNHILLGLHDSVLLYSRAVDEMFSKGMDTSNGSMVSRWLWNRTFHQHLISSEIYIDSNGDMDTDYSLFDVNQDLTLRSIFHFDGNFENQSLIRVKGARWPRAGSIPLDEITCNELCSQSTPENEALSLGIYFARASLFIIVLFFTFFGLSIFIHRKIKFEADLLSQWWRVKWEDVAIYEGSEKSFEIKDEYNRSTVTTRAFPIIPPVTGNHLGENLIVPAISEENFSTRNFSRKGTYKGIKVAIKALTIKRLTLNRTVLLELKQMKDIIHDNLIRFIGLCPDEGHIFLLTEYSQKGNLRDLLDNSALQIDCTFKLSLISDIVEGMTFIHSSPILFHGRLKSTNCLIDRRIVVKLGDFGLRSIVNQVHPSTGVDPRSLLWTAPEHLRQRRPEIRGSKQGDIYSFAIVLYEIITRLYPYDMGSRDSQCSVERILQRLKQNNSGPSNLFRPTIPDIECPQELIDLMSKCWQEKLADRPSFDEIRHQIKRMIKDLNCGSILDNLLIRMEKYANDLEKLVGSKTEVFLEEKRKCEEILYEVLPRYIARQLKQGHSVRPETFECVTIFFSDIVNFVQLTTQSTPAEIVTFLNDLGSLFDSILVSYDVFKVESVGAANVVVSGLPLKNGDEHCREIARMSLELRDKCRDYLNNRVKFTEQLNLALRMGINSGPCAAGVIGVKMPRYCLFGDTVNTASRMESNGEANKIHISQLTKNLLEIYGTFKIETRGEIFVKGKGQVITYWLLEEMTDKTNAHVEESA